MLINKRGAALLQVLIVAAILAGMSAMILRLTLSRTISSRQARHVIAVQTMIESCMAEVNTMWAAKTPAAYAQDLTNCQMCTPSAKCRTDEGSVTINGVFYNGNAVHKCEVQGSDGVSRDVYAVIKKVPGESTNPSRCQITYIIDNGSSL